MKEIKFITACLAIISSIFLALIINKNPQLVVEHKSAVALFLLFFAVGRAADFEALIKSGYYDELEQPKNTRKNRLNSKEDFNEENDENLT